MCLTDFLYTLLVINFLNRDRPAKLFKRLK